MRTLSRGILTVGAATALLLSGACGGSSDDDTASASQRPDIESTSTTKVSESTSSGHPCDLLPLAKVNAITGLTFAQTERFEATERANVDSCTFSLEDASVVPKGVARVVLSISRPSDQRSLSNTGAGSFMASTKIPAGTDKTIPGGIDGASDTGQFGGANYGQAAAQFGEERIVYVTAEGNVSIEKKGFNSGIEAVELLKALVAAGA